MLQELRLDAVATSIVGTPTISCPRRSSEKPRKLKNVVIFGETGVGKSSLINLIAGKHVSETSSSAVGCTLNYQRYLLTLDNQRFAIWDTAGLDEGSEGSVPAEKAEAYLKQLLRDLSSLASGVDLLVYCVRGTRVRSALLTNYHLFYSAICRKKVPIAIVVTGLENQEGNMGTWWLTNEKQLSALQMHFDNYACVTTLQSSVENATLEERLRISKAALIKMITSTCRTEQWMPARRSWAETAAADIRAILSQRDKNSLARAANVILCDVSRPSPVSPSITKRRSFTFRNPVLSLSFARFIRLRSPVSIVNGELQNRLPFNVSLKSTAERMFRVHQVPQKQTPPGTKEETAKKGMAVKRGADLLIFCAAKKAGECKDVKRQWDHFNLTYGGDLSPQIIVIIGAMDQQSAMEWWNDAVLGGAITRPGDAWITYWPKNDSFMEVEDAKGRLQDLINTCCIDCSKTNFAGSNRIFRRGTPSTTSLDKALISMWASQASRDTRSDEPIVSDWQDVLTKWHVWEHISTERDMVTEPKMTLSRALTRWDNKEQKPSPLSS